MMNRPYATREDMIKDIDVLMKTWKEYKVLYNEEINKRKGIISINTINQLIIKAKEIAQTKEEHEVSVEGFFDSYVAMLVEIGNSNVVHRGIDIQLLNLKEESLM